MKEINVPESISSTNATTRNDNLQCMRRIVWNNPGVGAMYACLRNSPTAYKVYHSLHRVSNPNVVCYTLCINMAAGVYT